MKRFLIVIAGTTASGKTVTAVELAKKLKGEIISADSMQVYKFMDIGTAKPTTEEMQGIPHYIIDELYPDETFNVSVFKNMALKYMDIIYSKNKIPIIVGGTGFYINALLYDADFNEFEIDYSYRDYLYKIAQAKGNIYLHNLLSDIDPKSASVIHFNNIKKVIRALEYYNQTNKPISLHNELQKKKESPYNFIFVILTMDRKILYNRIEQRVDKMIADGLVSEVSKLLDMKYSPNLVSLQGIGYKEIISYLNNMISLEEAIETIKINTRHFAKRQLTWFKTQASGLWVNVDECEFNINYVLTKISNYIENNITLL